MTINETKVLSYLDKCGKHPSTAKEISFTLRLSDDETDKALTNLRKAGLVRLYLSQYASTRYFSVPKTPGRK
jgi:DNA-binding MarR family transcriptional regulator